MNEMIWEDVQSDESLEYPFLCFVKLPTLQEMASYRFCQAIWQAYISSQTTSLRDIVCDRDEIHENRIEQWVKNLNITKPTEEMLIRAETEIKSKLSRFFYCLDKSFNVIESNEDPILPMDFSWCVWLSNGELDYRRTATKMCKRGRLNEMQKFFLCCKFCLEDEIRSIRLGSLPRHVREIQFHENAFQFYWVCYLKNELSQVPSDEDRTLEESMALLYNDAHNDVGCEYFLLRMTNDDRISVAEKILERKEGWWNVQSHITERLCSSISSSSTKPLDHLFPSYLKFSFQYAVSKTFLSLVQLRIWHSFKNQITADDFVSLISTAFSSSILRACQMQVLINLWDMSYDHQQKYAAQHLPESIIYNFIDWYPETYGFPCLAAFEMVYRILSVNPQSERSRLFNRYSDLFGRLMPLECLKKTLHLCLPSAIDQSEFKNTFSRSEMLQDTCVSFLQFGKKADLNARLEWLLSDRGPNAVREYKKFILTSMAWMYPSKVSSFFDSFAKWSKLNEFIEEAYTKDAPSAVRIKLTFAELANFQKNFDITKQIIETALPAQDLAYFKRKYLDNLAKQFRDYSYWKTNRDYDDFLPHLVGWLCDYNEEAISEFKNSMVPCSLILNAFNPKCTLLGSQRYTFEQLKNFLHRLDMHLRWYVGNDEKVRECKLQAIECCTFEVCNLRDIFIYGARDDYLQGFLNIVLNWFCDGDEEIIIRFKEQRLRPYL